MARPLRLHALSLSVTAAISVLLVAGRANAADTVVQVPVDGLINGRTVSTFTAGAIVPWVAGQGVDGDGGGDGYVTTAVEAQLVGLGKATDGKANTALPDDGVFPMDARHPEIHLHFSNAAAAASPQTYQLHQHGGAQSFQVPVPPATYSKMFLLITSSEGAAALTITLNYAGGAAPAVKTLTLPDYGVGGAAPNDAVFFNLIEGMRKWNSMNNEGDGPSHAITGIELAPSATDQLTSIGVEKTNGSYVVFWGATGIATSPVDVGTGGGGSGAGGAAGAAGVAGTGGAASGGAATAGSTSGGAAGAASVGGAGAGGTATTLAGAAGAPPIGVAGSAPTGAGGAAAATPSSSSSDSGGCAFVGFRTRTAAGWLSLLVVGGLVLARRRSA